MASYVWGSPYQIARRDKVNPETTETVHEKRYELVYDFETKEPLSLRQATEMYGQILARPEIEEGTKIKYFEITQSSTKGRVFMQFESRHPAITLAVIATVCIAALIIAGTIAAIIFIVPPLLAAGYVLTTGIAALPNWAKMVVGVAFIGGVLYLGYKLVGKVIERKKKAEVEEGNKLGLRQI